MNIPDKSQGSISVKTRRKERIPYYARKICIPQKFQKQKTRTKKKKIEAKLPISISVFCFSKQEQTLDPGFLSRINFAPGYSISFCCHTKSCNKSLTDRRTNFQENNVYKQIDIYAKRKNSINRHSITNNCRNKKSINRQSIIREEFQIDLKVEILIGR